MTPRKHTRGQCSKEDLYERVTSPNEKGMLGWKKCAIEGCQKEEKMCNRRMPKGGFFALESKEATGGSCLIPAGLVGASCAQ